MPAALKQQGGGGLIEVLISLLVIAIGLIGLASLQTTSLQQVQATRFQQQANQMLADLSERIISNPDAAKQGFYDGDYLGSTTPDAVASAGSTTASKAEYDRWLWYTKLQNTGLPSPRFKIATISGPNSGKFINITMTWDAKLKGVGAPDCSGANRDYICNSLSVWVP